MFGEDSYLDSYWEDQNESFFGYEDDDVNESWDDDDDWEDDELMAEDDWEDDEDDDYTLE